MADILTIATAGRTSGQLIDSIHENYPRIDFVELQRLLKIRLLDYNVYDHSPLGRLLRYLETQVRSDLYLASLGLIEQRRHKLVFLMSERVGIPFAALNRLMPSRRPVVCLFTCWSPRQEYVTTRLRLFSSMDSIIVHCRSMKQHLASLGAANDRIHVIHYGVDQHFFRPQPAQEQVDGFIFSIGEVRSRDYPALFRAVDGLSIRLLVAASGRWYSREKEDKLRTQVPKNTTIGNYYTQLELRQIYSQCHFVVLPIRNTMYSAGATAILEAMCMGKAVIVTRSAGIVDYVKNGETGIIVDQNDETGLRNSVECLLAHPEEARRLGQNGRRWVEEELNLDRYVNEIAELIQSTDSLTDFMK